MCMASDMCTICYGGAGVRLELSWCALMVQIAIAGFGAGLTWASAIVKWG